MTKKQKLYEALYIILCYFILFLVFAVVAGLIGMEVFVWVKFGGKPVSEIPAWALFFMIGK